MMHKTLLNGGLTAVLLTLCPLVAPAAAQQIETVTVYGGSLSGIWKVGSPSSVGISLFGSATWGPLQPVFCRIDYDSDGYATHCYGPGIRGGGGALEMDKQHFHLAWGTMMARFVFDGAVDSATHFSGHFAIKFVGIPIHDPDLSEGTKIGIKPDAPDTGGKAQLLRSILEGGAPPHDAALQDNFAAAHALSLGKIEVIAWLGQMSGRDHPDPAYLTVYAVEFEQGERLCALHQMPDGRLDAFQCY
jgi:hypothetical protein